MSAAGGPLRNPLAARGGTGDYNKSPQSGVQLDARILSAGGETIVSDVVA